MVNRRKPVEAEIDHISRYVTWNLHQNIHY